MRADEAVRRWWAGEGGAPGRALHAALAPAEWLFRGAAAARSAAYGRGWLPVAPAPLPVVSIGNLAVGGAGKTPFAAWVAARYHAWGHRPAVGLRGYGADEVLVHRELNPEVPVLAAPRRIRAAREAARAGRGVLVLDDAFQHRALARDLDVVLISAEGWIPRPRLLPRGPWREDVGALRRADMVVVTRKSAGEEEAAEVAARLAGRFPGLPLAGCWLAPGGVAPLHPSAEGRPPPVPGAEVLAVAALAAPGPFAAQLRAAGYRVETAFFPDHHHYNAGDARTLLARAAGRPVLMTLKDAVKLRALLPPGAPAWVLHQEVRVTSGLEALEGALRRAVEERR